MGEQLLKRLVEIAGKLLQQSPTQAEGMVNEQRQLGKQLEGRLQQQQLGHQQQPLRRAS